MPYPEEFNLPFQDRGTLRLVDIAGNVPVHPNPGNRYMTRHDWGIRKLVLHYHAGHPHSTVRKIAAGQPFAGTPQFCFNVVQNTMITDNGWPGYAYHHDIGYGEELVTPAPGAAPRKVVYRTQHPNKMSYHTGPNENPMGLSVSLFGSHREEDHYTGQYGTGAPVGAPSDFQRQAAPELIGLLQTDYAISDLHVTGHFQHGKPACPGWDFAFWVMHKQETSRRAQRAFCWPINSSGGAGPEFLTTPAAALAAGRRLVANTLQNGSGFYPFNRQFLWHGGVHLFGRANQDVHAVRDGWVVAARLDKNVVVDGRDYGSAGFVLVFHDDPGLMDPFDEARHTEDWQISGRRHCVRPLRYYSLYMHLAPLDETIPWVAMLRDRDRRRYDAMVASPAQARHLSTMAIPVKAGDVIGRIGRHNAFMARPDDAPADVNNTATDPARRNLIHFEMFSPDVVNGPMDTNYPGLLASFDPDAALAARWTVTDTNTNVFAEDVERAIDGIAGFADDRVADLRRIIAEAALYDETDATVWGHLLQSEPALYDALTKVVVRMRSEWRADFGPVADARYQSWGLDLRGRDHLKRVVREFQWWNEAAVNWTLPAGNGQPADTWRPGPSGLPPINKAYHYHPVRLLLWLHGLTRTLDHQPTGGIDADGFPISTNIWADMARLTSVRPVDGRTDQVRIPAAEDRRRLDRGAIRIRGHNQVYSITGFTTAGGFHRLDIAPNLEAEVRGATRAKLGTYGWHYRAHFDWNASLT